LFDWALANGCPTQVSTCVAFAGSGDLQALQWAKTKGCEWDEAAVAAAAARGGHPLILKWLYATVAIPDLRILRQILMEGIWAEQFDVIKWVCSLRCATPWPALSLMWAAENGRLDMMKWMCEQSPPPKWMSNVITAAVDVGRVDIVKWARENGCPIDGWARKLASRRPEMLALMNEYGAPAVPDLGG
jgi:hypothetical protein